ncbi:MAG TPA: two-component regulator propeller domain-containing protein [Candidatus Acidoferrales bacterium]|nr:two-component regulator propeller domain-containing protein [Candidatus Acidoferrales bacterium]
MRVARGAMWGSLVSCGGLAIRPPQITGKPSNAAGSLPHRAGGFTIRRTLESRLWKFGCAPTPGGRIANPPQVHNLPHMKHFWAGMLLCTVAASTALALDPRKSLTQYSHRLWTQQDGLPQDTIRAIAQTTDGYLWLGTDEGLARFDGYEFVSFSKANGDLPGNSITALAATADGSLWIGTSNGLAQYRDHRFHTFTVKQGLPDNAITALYSDHAGTLWLVAGLYLSRYQNGQFTNYRPQAEIPLSSVRAVSEDRHHDLWVAGFSRVVKMSGGGKFVTMMEPDALQGMVVLSMISDRGGNLWIGGNQGIIERTADGGIRKYTQRDGLPDLSVRALWQDREGNIWAGTNNGFARLESGRFATSREAGRDADLVRCLFEDREGNLWIGSNSGLMRLRSDIFTVYGEAEGLPSDEPNTVFQDRAGRVWVGFHDSGLMLFSGGTRRVFTTRDGLPDNDVFQVRQASNGDLLVTTRAGLARMQGTHFRNYTWPDPLGRRGLFDALEDRQGRLWLATPGGLGVLRGNEYRDVVPGGPLLIEFMASLCEGRDGALWAGTYGKGLWRIKGAEQRLFTTADGLSSDEIRSLYEDPEGTLWIATFGGGLNAWRDGRFFHYTAKDGLPSDNVAQVSDDGPSLWLSTTRGISRISKRQLRDFSERRRTLLEPENYGVEDGLRSAQCAPGYPKAGGGTRTADGRLWFTTGRGLAVLDPGARKQTPLAPAVQVVDMTANGDPVDLARPARLEPSSERLQIRYTGIYLGAPERVQYSYRLDGLDKNWVAAGNRRVIDYNTLSHGPYRFTVRALLPGGPASEQSYAFEVLPHIYETAWFRLLCAVLVAAAAWAVYGLRLRQIRYRFSLVLDERARLAREIHDTLAQGFVGISSQLDAVAMCMPDEKSPARKYLDLARRMARHSLTEARRSVMDLRASALEGQDLIAAIESGTRMWTAGSGVRVEVVVDAGTPGELPEEMEQHLLRIAQEAVTNVLKHAEASQIWVKLHAEARKLYLRIADDGRGFEQADVFQSRGGHFGLIGMRERAERLGGELHLSSHPGEGTEVEVMVPLP